MRITIPKALLVNLVAKTKGACDDKSPMAALANILLTAEGGALRATGTDFYRASYASAACDVSEPGSIALPAADLDSRVKAMPDGPIELATDGTCADVRAVGKARRFKFTGLPASEYPAVPAPTGEPPTVTLPAAALSRLIALTMFSASTDVSRAQMNGALLAWTPTEMRMVTTDGHRISMCTVATENIVSGDVFIPLDALKELWRLVGGAEGNIPITVGQPWVFSVIDGAGTTFAFKQTCAQFPPYQKVIPAEIDGFTISRAAFADALKAVALAAGDATGRGVKLTFAPSVVRICASGDKGTANDEVPCGYAGDGFTIGANSGYLVAPLSAVGYDDVMLSVNGPEDPLVVRCEGYVAAVMPMKL